MTIKRLPNWEVLLRQAEEKRWTQKFVRGQSDCVLTVADMVREFVENQFDIAARYRGKYNSDLEAMRFVRNECGGDMLAEFRKNFLELDITEINPKLAQRGDVGYVDGGDITNSGACIFVGYGALSPADVGFTRVPRSKINAAWRIG